MDRQIVYVSSAPQDTDILNTNKFAMQAVGSILQGAVGVNTGANGSVYGLAVTAAGGATPMQINVAPGGIIVANQPTDQNAFGSLGADTTPLYKCGIVTASTPFTITAPTTSTQSRTDLIQVTFQESDAGSQVLPYYNASNPTQGFSGPAGSGSSQATNRIQRVLVNRKLGTPATTGTQTPPPTDIGYVAIATVTVAFGQSSITSANISRINYPLTSTPYLDYTLAGLQYIPDQINQINARLAGTQSTLTYTPANKQGDTFWGAVAIGDSQHPNLSLSVTGALTRAGWTVWDQGNLVYNSQLQNNMGYLTAPGTAGVAGAAAYNALTSTMVTTALGYTPLSSNGNINNSTYQFGNLNTNGYLRVGGFDVATISAMNTGDNNTYGAAIRDANTNAVNSTWSLWNSNFQPYIDNRDTAIYQAAAGSLSNNAWGWIKSFGSYGNGNILMITGSTAFGQLVGSPLGSTGLVTVTMPTVISNILSIWCIGVNAGFNSYPAPEASEMSVGVWQIANSSGQAGVGPYAQITFQYSRVTGTNTGGVEGGVLYWGMIGY